MYAKRRGQASQPFCELLAHRIRRRHGLHEHRRRAAAAVGLLEVERQLCAAAAELAEHQQRARREQIVHARAQLRARDPSRRRREQVAVGQRAREDASATPLERRVLGRDTGAGEVQVGGRARAEDEARLRAGAGGGRVGWRRREAGRGGGGGRGAGDAAERRRRTLSKAVRVPSRETIVTGGWAAAAAARAAERRTARRGAGARCCRRERVDIFTAISYGWNG